MTSVSLTYSTSSLPYSYRNPIKSLQEVRSYDAKLKEAHGRLRRLREENVELRQICLYLDEQRHAVGEGITVDGVGGIR